MKKQFKIRKIVRGSAQGEALVIPHSFSFMGDIDMNTSEIIAEGNINKGKKINGKILIYTETKGSSGGMVVLMTLAKKGIAPKAIITVKPVDYNLAEGAILAKVPFACEPDGDIISEIKNGDIIRVNTDEGLLEIM